MRIGIDLGGTKIEGIVLRGDSEVLLRRRILTPAGQYQSTLAAVAALVRELEQEAGAGKLPVGVGQPGAISPASGRIKNANSTCLNDQPTPAGSGAGARPRAVRMANDVLDRTWPCPKLSTAPPPVRAAPSR